MPGLVPGIHVFCAIKQTVDGRDKPGHDEAICDSAYVFGAALAAFNLSSMHLVTMSARLSISAPALLFSVFIQHSVAARARVIGSSGLAGSAGLAAAGLACSEGLPASAGLPGSGGFGAIREASGSGLTPPVSQPASNTPATASRAKSA
ncbi:MAG: hypothetical protein EXR03_02575, partial [Pseudolabrys sp.]|nr:hypothetical protein [Pseudolabrys sp.]